MAQRAGRIQGRRPDHFQRRARRELARRYQHRPQPYRYRHPVGSQRKLVKELEQLSQTRNVNDSYTAGKPQFDISLNDEGRALGLTGADIGGQLRDAFYGSVALRQLRGINENEIRVRLPEYQRQDLEYLDNFVIRTPSGQEVPLMDVARVTIGESFRSIDRRDGRRVITVGTDVQPKSATRQVLDVVQAELLPQLRADFPGLTWTFQGGQADMRESTSALWGGFALAMGVIYALLAIAFGSYLQPVVVMLAIPFGAVGAIMGHMVLGMELSLVSIWNRRPVRGGCERLADHGDLRQPPEKAHEHGPGHLRGRYSPLPAHCTDHGNHRWWAYADYLGDLPAGHLPDTDGESLGFGIVFATALILFLVPCLYLALKDAKSAVTARRVQSTHQPG